MHFDNFTLLGIVAAVVVSAFVLRLIAREGGVARQRPERSDEASDDDHLFARP